MAEQEESTVSRKNTWSGLHTFAASVLHQSPPLLQSIFIVLIFLCIVLLVYETFRSPYTIVRPLVVPGELAELGYTQEAVGSRLLDHVGLYAQEVAQARVGRVADQIEIRELETLEDGSFSKDFFVPGLAFSLRTTASYLRSLRSAKDDTISGGMVMDKSTNRVHLHLRYNEREVFSESSTFTHNEIDNLLRGGAAALLKRMRPSTLAAYYFLKRDMNKASEILSFIFANTPPSNSNYVHAVNTKGNVHQANEDYDAAIKEYRRAIELNSNIAFVHTNLAAALVKRARANEEVFSAEQCLANRGQYSGYCEAIEHYKIALKEDPKDTVARLNWGTLLYRAGEHRSAISKFREALNFESGIKTAHAYLGMTYLETEDFPSAIDQFMLALEIDPNYLGAHFGWCIALKRHEHHAYALEDCAKECRGYFMRELGFSLEG